ncbi:MAG: aldehyde ferredoxin oxidoreductase N-terminal domain-containing protein, partial [Syntrophobacterales bacterium]
MITTGPLTGTPAPTSGRVEIGGVAAQSFPEMYSHSGIGGWLGPELKYAGYDAIIIQGKAPSHSYILIDNQTVSIKDASYLWGMGTYDCQQELKKIHGEDTRSLVIGPAGENLSRIAVLMSENANAAGQGGFGGVAGSKNLKAICIRGTGSIKIARSGELLSLRSRVTKKPSQNPAVRQGPFEFFGHTIENIPWEKYFVACSHSCDRFCMPAFKNIPRSSRPGLHSNEIGCIGNMSVGWQHSDTWEGKPVVEWPLWSVDLERGTEVIELLNQYGINQYEVLGGMVPWITMAAHEGLFT